MHFCALSYINVKIGELCFFEGGGLTLSLGGHKHPPKPMPGYVHEDGFDVTERRRISPFHPAISRYRRPVLDQTISGSGHGVGFLTAKVAFRFMTTETPDRMVTWPEQEIVC